MALQPGEYVENGAVKNAKGHVVLVGYSDFLAETYQKQDGRLIDADGRWVTTND